MSKYHEMIDTYLARLKSTFNEGMRHCLDLICKYVLEYGEEEKLCEFLREKVEEEIDEEDVGFISIKEK